MCKSLRRIIQINTISRYSPCPANIVLTNSNMSKIGKILLLKIADKLQEVDLNFNLESWALHRFTITIQIILLAYLTLYYLILSYLLSYLTKYKFVEVVQVFLHHGMINIFKSKLLLPKFIPAKSLAQCHTRKFVPAKLNLHNSY